MKKPRGKRIRKRPSVQARGYGAEWKRARKRKIEQDPLCEPCQSVKLANLRLEAQGVAFRYRALRRPRRPHRAEIVDHMIPLPEGTHDLENLMSVCRSRHAEKTAWEVKHGKSRGVNPGVRRHRAILPWSVVLFGPFRRSQSFSKISSRFSIYRRFVS